MFLFFKHSLLTWNTQGQKEPAGTREEAVCISRGWSWLQRPSGLEITPEMAAASLHRSHCPVWQVGLWEAGVEEQV